MTWFKVDDTFSMHPKVLAAGNAAAGLWVRAGAWSMQQLTDGFIPIGVARTLGSVAEARHLVAAGLWIECDDGYQFHEWVEVQRTKDQVKADRHAATERQRKAREAAKSRRESQEQSRRDIGVSNGPPDQTRPDQTSSSYGTTNTSCAPADADDATEGHSDPTSIDDRFEEFWTTYDKPTGKVKARQKWRRAIKKPGVDADLLIAAASRYIAAQRAKGKHREFTKDPTTWLNGEHWTDEIPALKSIPVSGDTADWMRRRPGNESAGKW